MRAANLKKKDRAVEARSDWWGSMGCSQSQDVATPFGLGVTLVVGLTIGVTSLLCFLALSLHVLASTDRLQLLISHSGVPQISIVEQCVGESRTSEISAL